jgi:hypothetical protein
MAAIDLQYVDELLQARRALHGGGQGAPPIVNGARQGTALNRSCVLMISGLLQGYVEEVFFEVSAEKLGLSAAQIADYRKLYDRFGNPSPQNIRMHFRRLGVPDVLAGLSWQRRTAPSVVNALEQLNNLRNQIAHGAAHLRLGNQAYSLRTHDAEVFRNFAENFAARFTGHVRRQLGLP